LKNEDTHTDKQLEELFKSFEPPVPKGSWEGIAGVLDRKRNRRIFMWWIVAAAVFVGGLFGLWFGLADLKQDRIAQKQEEVTKTSDAKKDASGTHNMGNDDYSGTKEQSYAEGQSGGEAKTVVKSKFNKNFVPEIIKQNQLITETAPVIIQNNLELLEPLGLRIIPSQWPASEAITWVKLPKTKPFKAPISKWTASLGVMQMHTGNDYSVNPANSRYVHKNYLNRLKEGEQNMGGAGFSLQLGYQITPKYTVTGGVQFRQLNIRQQFSFSDEVPVTLVPGNTPDKFGNYPIIGYFGNTGSVSYNGFQRNTIVELPLGINGDFSISPKWSVKPAIAINTGIISGISGFTLDYQQLQLASQQSDWFRKVQMSGSLSVGAFRRVSRKLQWGASLGGSRMFTPVYVPDASIRPRNHAVGIGTQLIWRID
jgi:hypothetical protein